MYTKVNLPSRKQEMEKMISMQYNQKTSSITTNPKYIAFIPLVPGAWGKWDMPLSRRNLMLHTHTRAHTHSNL